MARILGIDLGSYSAKAVLVESAMRTYQVKSFAEVRRTEGQDRTQALRSVVANVFGEATPQADQVLVSLPGPSLVTHVITLPFVDPKRIEAALPFEVESQLPFDLSEVVFDYQLAAAAEKKSELLVGVVRKDELQALLAAFAEIKLEPRVVTHPAIAFQSFMLAMPQVLGGAGATTMVLDIGHERTCLAVGQPGTGIEFARTFAYGGKDLSRTLSTELQVPIAEANHWKETEGAMGPHASGPDGERATAAFVRGLQPLLRELRPTLKSFTSRTRRSVDRIYLCGGTSRLPGLAEQLEKDLATPCKTLLLPEAPLGPELAAQPSAAQAYALTVRAQISGARAPRFNLRRGELAYRGDYDYIREKAPKLGIFAAVLLVLFIASSMIRNAALAREEQQLDKTLCDITERVLGQCEKDFRRALSMLHGQESPAAAIPKVSAVNLLAEAIQRVPPDVKVTFTEMIVGLDRIELKSQADDSKQMDALIAALKQFRCFKEIKEGRVKRSADGTKVEFDLDVQVDCPEEAPPQG
jgi:general secretion pathway protein L